MPSWLGKGPDIRLPDTGVVDSRCLSDRIECAFWWFVSILKKFGTSYCGVVPLDLAFAFSIKLKIEFSEIFRFLVEDTSRDLLLPDVSFSIGVIRTFFSNGWWLSYSRISNSSFTFFFPKGSGSKSLYTAGCSKISLLT